MRSATCRHRANTVGVNSFFSAVAYRVEAKKLLTNTIKRIDSDIKLIKEVRSD